MFMTVNEGRDLRDKGQCQSSNKKIGCIKGRRMVAVNLKKCNHFGK